MEFWTAIANPFFSISFVILVSILIHGYLIDKKLWHFLSFFVFVFSISLSLFAVLLLSIDVYITSKGKFSTEDFQINRSSFQIIYLCSFGLLLISAYFVIPFSYYFYQKSEKSYTPCLQEESEICEITRYACQNTFFFICFVCFLLLIGLFLRSGHQINMESGKKTIWIKDLLDLDHGGISAILFALACLTLVGLVGFIFYTSYGLSGVFTYFLFGNISAARKRHEIQLDISAIREQTRNLQTKYLSEKGRFDTCKMCEDDRIKYHLLIKQQTLLSQENYKLQELELNESLFINKFLLLLVPFRLFIGVTMLTLSLAIFISLLLNTYDKFMNSTCGLACGYMLEKPNFSYNPLDSLLVFAANYFPLDHILLSFISFYILFSTLWGIYHLGIRLFCFSSFAMMPFKTKPQALLVMCFITIHILLALCLIILTMCPNYATYGYQSFSSKHGGVPLSCSLNFPVDACRTTAIATFFNKILRMYPFVAIPYFFANLIFLGTFFTFFIYFIFFKKYNNYLKDILEEDGEMENLDETKGLLQLERA